MKNAAHSPFLNYIIKFYLNAKNCFVNNKYDANKLPKLVIPTLSSRDYI